MAQSAYRYRDANGQWVFTDRADTKTAPGDSFTLAHEHAALHLAVDRNDNGESTQLVAVNDCLCTVTFKVSIVQSDFAAIANGTGYEATLAPGARQTLVRVAVEGTGEGGPAVCLDSRTRISGAVHNPPRPYRAPFAIGSTYAVSQAYPTRITHTTADSQYAVDIALPDGTPVYSAREGTVINVRHDSFRNGMSAAMLDQANVIEILHEDGTIAIYAHLHWDSIRVRIGERVTRGQYIADSGNTGFTSGPHLHFAVIRNAGAEDVSVPVQFAGIGGDWRNARDSNAINGILDARSQLQRRLRPAVPVEFSFRHRTRYIQAGADKVRTCVLPCPSRDSARAAESVGVLRLS
jgi:murein DD-endopeptidase MepM/ murein hydrolase activator NlpD